MSKLGSISGHIDRERELLRDLNNALLTLEAFTLGRANDFGFSKQDVDESKKVLIDFGTLLRSAIEPDQVVTELQPLVSNLKSGIKPLDDWKEDLDDLLANLNRDDLNQEVLPILEDLLSLLDIEFAEDLRRLYQR
jgi:hypothetical protein